MAHIYEDLNGILQLDEVIDVVIMALVETGVCCLISFRRLSDREGVSDPAFLELCDWALLVNLLMGSVHRSILIVPTTGYPVGFTPLPLGILFR